MMMMNDDDYISMGLRMGMMTGCTSDVKDQKQYIIRKLAKIRGGEIINKISQNINKISQNINKISQDANFFENVKKKYYGYKIHVEQKLKK